MDVDRGFLGGFLILGVAIFIAGFFAGWLSIAVLGVPAETTGSMVVYLALGFVSGVVVGLILAFAWWSRKKKTGEQPKPKPVVGV